MKVSLQATGNFKGWAVVDGHGEVIAVFKHHSSAVGYSYSHLYAGVPKHVTLVPGDNI